VAWSSSLQAVRLVKNISQQKLNLPRFAPVMALPEVMLFPGAMLPLYIFEKRYRAMLTWTLEHHRMFCMAPMKPHVTEAVSVEDFHHTVGLGMVRACIAHENGTSHLVLQGLARVRLTGFVQEEPFRMAEIRELLSQPVEWNEVEPLIARLLKICARLQPDGGTLEGGLDQQLAKMRNPELLCDIIAQMFLSDPAQRQEIFEELRVGKRLELLARHLEGEADAEG
jgi:Lon protease-like protein